MRSYCHAMMSNYCEFNPHWVPTTVSNLVIWINEYKIVAYLESVFKPGFRMLSFQYRAYSLGRLAQHYLRFSFTLNWLSAV